VLSQQLPRRLMLQMIPCWVEHHSYRTSVRSGVPRKLGEFTDAYTLQSRGCVIRRGADPPSSARLGGPPVIGCDDSSKRDRTARNRLMRDPGKGWDEIRISNCATYWTAAPLDLLIATPVVTRFLLGATPLGGLLQGVVVGMYLGSGLRDWSDRQGIRRIDFYREFGADVGNVVAMPRE